MRVTISAATLLAWVSAALAQTAGFDAISLPAKDESVSAGSTYTVRWDYTPKYAGTVSIQLLQGATPTTLQLGPVVASGVDNAAGSYTWAVPASLGADATYGLKITYDSNPEVFQYSFPFHIAAAKAAASSSSSAAAAPATTPAPSAGVSTDEADVESTVYSTEMITITSCAATVTDCPARSTVTSSTLRPITTSGAPAPSAPAAVPSAPAANSPPAPAQPQTTLTPAYPVGNGTTPGGPMGTVTLKTSTSVAAGTGSIPNPTTTGKVPFTTNGAGRVAAGSVALVAGVMAAVFAL